MLVIHWRKSFYREFWKKLNISVFIGKTDIFVMLTILTIWAFYMSKKPKCEIETASKWCLLSDSCKESPKTSFIVLVIHWRNSFYREFWKKLNISVFIGKTDIFVMLTILAIWAFYMSKKPKCEIETASKWCLLSDSCKESPKKDLLCLWYIEESHFTVNFEKSWI